MRNLKLLIVAVLACAALAAQKPAGPMPPVEIRAKGGEYGPEKWSWEGVAVVADPVNHETLYLGGRCGGAEFGTLGNWALADDGKTWREVRQTNAVLDPLRGKILAARRLARDAEAGARNLFYAGMDSAAQAQAVKRDPLKRIGDSLKSSQETHDALQSAQPVLADAEAIGHARPLLEKAIVNLKAAARAFADGSLDAAALKHCFDAQWALDEAADCVASSPGPRVGAFTAYDPARQSILLFGGSHGDYVMSDTWLYDCKAQSWRQCFPAAAPSPRAFSAVPILDEKKQPAAQIHYDETRKKIILSGGVTLLNKMVYQNGFTPLPSDEWSFDTETGEWAAAGEPLKRSTEPGSRFYRTVVPAYDPTWFDGAPRGDAAATSRWLVELIPNTWTKVPVPDRPAVERDWGTARYDPDRDQIYRWTGGHQADPSNAMTTYHPALNRYSIGYVPEIYGKGMSFNGRPDCLNHTYLNWDYDPVSRCVVCVTMGGTGVYNPDRQDWDFSIAQPFNHHIYLTCTVSTPRGVIVWTPGFFGVMDVAKRQWTKLPVTGTLPRSQTDGSALTYDGKRDCVWFFSHTDYQKPSGQVWQYDLKTGIVKATDPAGRAPFAARKGLTEIRECAYLPTADLVLLNNFSNGKEVAYDPAANRWVLLPIRQNQERLGSVSDTLVYDSRRDLVWNLNSYKAIYVLKLDRSKMEIEKAP